MPLALSVDREQMKRETKAYRLNAHEWAASLHDEEISHLLMDRRSQLDSFSLAALLDEERKRQ